MLRGWFVGDFSPTALATRDCEVAIKHYAAGEREDVHYHLVATEVTAILSGRVRMVEREWSEGDVIVLDPGEATGFEALTDATTVVVKMPSVKGDKYSVA
jgi:quercetin dioxygenase-like cupin family protein